MTLKKNEQKRKEEDDSLWTIAKLISWLDGYVAFSCVDPIRIEKLVKSYPSNELISAWNQVKKDVYSIGQLPASSLNVIKYAKIHNVAKVLFVFIAMIAIISWTALTKLNIPALSGPNGGLILLGILVVAYNINIFLFFYSGRAMSQEVNSQYSKQKGAVSKERKHVREVTQHLINVLTLQMGRLQLDARKYEFTLFNRDYNNIRIVKEKGPTVTAIVKARRLGE